MKLIFGNRNLIERRALKLIEEKIQELLKNQNHVTIAIPGGRSISGLFNLFKESRIPWKRTHIFMLDERKVPIFDPQSNFKLARDSFLKELMDKKRIKKENIHAYNFQTSANSYFKELKKYGGKFDIVVLGAGEDGHIASLFPKSKAIKSSKPGYLEVKNAPENPTERISASYNLIRKSDLGILLFLSEKKKNSYEKFINSNLKIKDCPSKIIHKIKESYILTDIN